MEIYLNEIGNRTTTIIKTGYYLELLTPETKRLLGSIKSKITKNENDKIVPHLKITEVVLIHGHIINNDHQQDWRVLNTSHPNKSFGPLQDISPNIFVLLPTFNLEFSYIEIWFTDQNSQPLKIEVKTNIPLV